MFCTVAAGPTTRVVERPVQRVVADPQPAAALQAQQHGPSPDDAVLPVRADALPREIARPEWWSGHQRTGLEFTVGGRPLAQAIDKEWATLQGVAVNELCRNFWAPSHRLDCANKSGGGLVGRSRPA